MFFYPDSKLCAEEYDEGPDAEAYYEVDADMEEDENESRGI